MLPLPLPLLLPLPLPLFAVHASASRLPAYSMNTDAVAHLTGTPFTAGSEALLSGSVACRWCIAESIKLRIPCNYKRLFKKVMQHFSVY